MKLLKRKGFTLIELVIGLALTSIVFLVIASFFLSNNNTINKTHIKSELQSEGEYIMSYISKNFMEGKSIKALTFGEKERFKSIEISSYKKELNREFYLDGKTLICRIVDGKNIQEKVIGQNVEDIRIDNDGKEFQNAKSLEIEIILSKKDVVYKLKDNIFFRNSGNEEEKR